MAATAATTTTANTTVVFITGANSGIGFDTAALLATTTAYNDTPYHVVLGVRSLAKGQKAVDEIRSRGATGPLTVVQIDVTDPASVRAAADQVASELGRVDVLLNNAGIFSLAPDLATQMRASLATNATGPAIVTEAFAPLLKKSSDPRLIYISSSLGSIGDPVSWYPGLLSAAYRVSKAALNMLAAYHHHEFAEWGCKVWALCPGYVVTNLGGEESRKTAIAHGALSAETSAATIHSVIQGKRDADAGKFIHKGGVYAW